MVGTLEITICIVIIVLIFIIYWLFQLQTSLMCGFWMMDADFMKEAGLTKFVLFIDKNLKDGYLLISAEESEIYNAPVELSISRQQYNIMSQCKYSITLKEIECFPENMCGTFDPVAMSFIWHKDDKICGSLYKDRFATKHAFDTEKIKPDINTDAASISEDNDNE